MDSGVGNQVGLELVDINVEGSLESEGASQTGNDLRDASVEVGVVGLLDLKRLLGDGVDSLIVEHERDISVLQQSVSGKDAVVGLNDSGRDLRRRVDAEVHLHLLAVVDAKSLQEKSSKSRPSTSSDRVEYEESLKSRAGISDLADSVKGDVDKLLTNGIMATSVVVGSVLLATDEGLRVEELSVSSSSDLVDNRGLQIEEDSSRNVLARRSLTKEGVEGILLNMTRDIRHSTVGIDAMLHTIELPNSITSLASSLSDVDRDNLTHSEIS